MNPETHSLDHPQGFLYLYIQMYWQKNGHQVLVNRLVDIGLPRKSVVRLTDHPAMAIAVDRGH